MNAFHACSSAPFFASAEQGASFRMEPFELLCMALSALAWRRENGHISLVADTEVAAYVHRQGLEPLWDDGVNVSLDGGLEGLDAHTFWAAGKLLALREMTAPCVMLDLDMIIWRELAPKLQEYPVAVAHREKLYPPVYPSPEAFAMEHGYVFPERLDWDAHPCNTAFVYFGDEALRREYVHEALRFMRAARGMDRLTYMVFSEQRLLAMLCARRGLRVGTLLPDDGVFAPQTHVTHLWGYKRRLREDAYAREDFIRRCLLRIRRDYPAWFSLIAAAEEIVPYAQKLH